MNASVIDLRYKMNDVLKALDRNEEVTILYHGKVKGVLKSQTTIVTQKVTDHPFFNMANCEEPVNSVMQHLREGRFNDI